MQNIMWVMIQILLSAFNSLVESLAYLVMKALPVHIAAEICKQVKSVKKLI